jgi:hypothetical protein
VLDTTFLTTKEAQITMVWSVLRNHAACMRYMNLAAYMEAFSAHAGAYLSSGSYKPRLARASLRSNKRKVTLTLK